MRGEEEEAEEAEEEEEEEAEEAEEEGVERSGVDHASSLDLPERHGVACVQHPIAPLV